MATCSFCGIDIPFGTGKMYVKKDAKVLYFCSRRCEKNMNKLKRTPREVGFTQAAKGAKKQRLSELAHARKAAVPKEPAEPKAAAAKKEKVQR